MLDEIVMKTILTIVGFLVTGILGYFTAKIKEYKKKDNDQQEALKCLLRSAITKIYYNYTSKGEIPAYERENATYLYEQYKKMGGNSYIDELYPEIIKLPIEKK